MTFQSSSLIQYNITISTQYYIKTTIILTKRASIFVALLLINAAIANNCAVETSQRRTVEEGQCRKKGARGNDSSVCFCFITAKLLFPKLGYCLSKPPHHGFVFVTAPTINPLSSSNTCQELSRKY